MVFQQVELNPVVIPFVHQVHTSVLKRDVRLVELELRHAGGPVPRPPHWGGYRVVPVAVEFWQGRPDRLHDRLRYRRLESGTWTLERLAP